MPDLGGDDLGEGGLVALALGLMVPRRAIAAAGRVDPDLAGIEHAEAEDVAVA